MYSFAAGRPAHVDYITSAHQRTDAAARVFGGDATAGGSGSSSRPGEGAGAGAEGAAGGSA
jgi:hypothetical protein